jgi:hypothetical protein
MKRDVDSSKSCTAATKSLHVLEEVGLRREQVVHQVFHQTVKLARRGYEEGSVLYRIPEPRRFVHGPDGQARDEQGAEEHRAGEEGNLEPESHEGIVQEKDGRGEIG